MLLSALRFLCAFFFIRFSMIRACFYLLDEFRFCENCSFINDEKNYIILEVSKEPYSIIHFLATTRYALARWSIRRAATGSTNTSNFFADDIDIIGDGGHGNKLQQYQFGVKKKTKYMKSTRKEVRLERISIWDWRFREGVRFHLLRNRHHNTHQPHTFWFEKGILMKMC